MSKKIKPKSGEVFAIKFPNEYWCALVILGTEDNSCLVYTTAYYDLKKPTIDHHSLKEFYYIKDIYSGDKVPSIYWLTGKPDNRYHLIGEIDLQDKIGIDSSVYNHGSWKTYIPRQLMMDRDPRMKILSKVKDNNPSKIKVEELSEDVFWSFIALIDMSKKNPMRALIKKLKDSSVEVIYSFEETLSHKLYLLDTLNHAGQSEDYLSPDAFLYARCSVVAKGRDFYEDVVQNSLAIDLEGDAEELLEVSSEAYEKKTDDIFDYVSTYDYETFSNESGWKKDI